MIEAKNNYAGLIQRLGGKAYLRLGDEWLKQANRQLAAAPDRPIIWYFNDESAANYARALFGEDESNPRSRIKVVYLPMKGINNE